MKFKLYHPQEMLRFFIAYAACFGTEERRGKEFFNYCKMVVYNASSQQNSALAEEVREAEGTVRFFAGAFYALTASAATLLLCWIVQLCQVSRAPYHATATGIAAITLLLLAWMIVHKGRFRLLRLKEVDTVFDAFYLVHRHPDECQRCASLLSPDASSDERARERLLRDALTTDGLPTGRSVLLPQVVRLMKERSLINPVLSSLYFAGSQVDHPYFLQNDDVAVGLAVLPEDEPKSRAPKRHPHQRETIIVLTGPLTLDVVAQGQLVQHILESGAVHVIPPGQCHSITAHKNNGAVYLFVKTNPAEHPKAEPCDMRGS